jgi:hypothetical protein
LVQPGPKGHAFAVTLPVLDHPFEEVLHQIFTRFPGNALAQKEVEQIDLVALKQHGSSIQPAIGKLYHQFFVSWVRCALHLFRVRSILGYLGKGKRLREN